MRHGYCRSIFLHCGPLACVREQHTRVRATGENDLYASGLELHDGDLDENDRLIRQHPERESVQDTVVVGTVVIYNGVEQPLRLIHEWCSVVTIVEPSRLDIDHHSATISVLPDITYCPEEKHHA